MRGRNATIVVVANPETEEEIRILVSYKWYHDTGSLWGFSGLPEPDESEIEILNFSAEEGELPSWVTEPLVMDSLLEIHDLYTTDSD